MEEFCQKMLTRQEILTMDKQGAERGKFFTKILRRFGAYFKLNQPITQV